MHYTNNQGLIVAGNGVLNAGQVAVGPNARIDSIVHFSSDAGQKRTIEDLRFQVDELLAVIRENRDRVAPEAEKAIETVKEQVALPEPNKIVVTSILSGVSELVKSFGSLSGAIVAVRELVAVVLK